MNTNPTTLIGKASTAQDSAAHRVLLIGIGNEFRRDDTVGILMARRIKERNLLHVRVLEESGEGTRVMDLWKDAAAVIIVDATSTNGIPGAIRRIDLLTRSIPKNMTLFTTHAFGVVQAVELARGLKSLPAKMILFGIEGNDFSPGLGLSPELSTAMSGLEDLLADELTSLVQSAKSDKQN